MNIIFCRIGYMQKYQGTVTGDQISDGGAFNNDDDGSEIYNFLDIEGILYGYVQPTLINPYRINIQRIGVSENVDHIDNVLVIWIARHPNFGQVIVGWYKNATVYSLPVTPNNLPARENRQYYIKARSEDCFLLPEKDRTYPIEQGRDHPGRANIFYTLDKDGEPRVSLNGPDGWIYKVIEYIGNYNSENDDTDNRNRYSGTGFQVNQDIKKSVEIHAMNRCREYFDKENYTVEDCSSSNPYDFKISKGNDVFYVEVKGTQEKGVSKIILTNNEVDFNSKNWRKMILFIVHSIDLVDKGSGEILIANEWKISKEKLVPINYFYNL